jgi:hypothetical protein
VLLLPQTVALAVLALVVDALVVVVQEELHFQVVKVMPVGQVPQHRIVLVVAAGLVLLDKPQHSPSLVTAGLD